MRHGPSITTYSGKRFYYLDPRPEDVVFEDIAHAGSIEPRWGGHTDAPFYVNQHSVLLSLYVPVEYRLLALLHDASEVYMRDLPGPLKHSLGLAAYREIESEVQKVVYEAFGVEPLDPEGYYEIIKVPDLRMQLTEGRDLFTPPRGRDDITGIPEELEPYPEKVSPWGWQATRSFFEQAWAEVTGESDYTPVYESLRRAHAEAA